jgi:phosphoribosylanthranilate isomerase
MKETKQLLANFNMSPEHLKELLPAIDLLTKILSDETPYEDQIMNLIADAEKGKAAGEGKPHEWPPIISLSETQDHYFKSGSAEISPAFRELLIAKTANQIATIAAQYGVNVVEVIGHTDEQRITGIRSNLDSEIADVLNGNKSIAALKPGDNAGLGLARALAVTQVLRGQPRLTGLTILPMSGAQLTLPSDDLTDGRDAGNSEGRRRIEIRVRKRNEIMSDATPTRLETPDVN